MYRKDFVSKRPVSPVTLKPFSLVHLSQTVPCQPPFLPPWGQLSFDRPGLWMLTVDYSVQFCFKELKKGVNGCLYNWKKTVKEVFQRKLHTNINDHKAKKKVTKSTLISFLSLPDIWRRHRWFSREMTSEKRAQKFHNNDWLEICLIQSYLGSDASSVWNFCARFSQTSFRGKPPVASQNVDCFLRLPESPIQTILKSS